MKAEHIGMSAFVVRSSDGEMSVGVSMRFGLLLIAMGLIPIATMTVACSAPMLLLSQLVGEMPDSWNWGSWAVYWVLVVGLSVCLWKLCISTWLDRIVHCSNRLSKLYPRTAHAIILAPAPV